MLIAAPLFRLRSALLGTVFAILAGCSPYEDGITLTGPTMGTTYTVRIASASDINAAKLQQRIDTRLRQLTAQLSHYETASAVSEFNRHNSTDWFAVPAELLTVADFALAVSLQSSGAFDITVAPAVDAWGFGPRATDGNAPDRAAVAATRQHIGYQKLDTRQSPPALRKHDPMLRLDLSALAKGYAVDQIAYLLETAGANNYLVEIGGEVRAAGLRSDGKPWRIGVQPPDGKPTIEFVVQPGDNAVATSGDYINYYLLDDQRISHTIDPAAGTPVANGLTAVTVIAPNAMQADAWATALMVMGPIHGMQFANNQDIPALFFARTAAGIKSSTSAAFADYLLVD